MTNGNDPKNRLMSKTLKNGDCVEYFGGLGSTGYGVFWLNGKSQNAHKASYILNVSEVPTGKWVLHTCDNKKCINPEHLYLGDRKQNTIDAVARNRMAKGDNHGSKTKRRSYVGEKNPFSKMSDKDCIAFYNGFKNGLKVSWMASQANLHQSCIYRAIKRADALINALNEKP